MFCPPHEHVGEIDVEKKFHANVPIEHCVSILPAFLFSHGIHMSSSFITDFLTSLVHVANAISTAEPVEHGTIVDHEGVVACWDDKAKYNVAKEHGLLAWFAGADERQDEEKTQNGTADKEGHEDFQVFFTIFVHVACCTHAEGSHYAENTEDFDTTIKWEAETALFTHLWA